MSVDVDNPDEDSSAEFEGLADRLKAEPVSQDQADARVESLLEKHLKGRTGRLTFIVDRNLPPETVIRVEGSTITLSQDAMDAIERHWKRTGQMRSKHPGRTVRKVGEPYKGS